MNSNQVTEQIIGAAIDVHKVLGPGLLESAYEECLCYELSSRSLDYSRQHSLPLIYKNVKLDCGYRLDILVNNEIVVEIKSVSTLEDIHEAQVLTYLKLGGWRLGLLINFNVPILIKGLKRIIH